jgi:hypothetical protein
MADAGPTSNAALTASAQIDLRNGSSPFGSPADLWGPVALRPRLAAGLPLSL